jgi:hypothetical protein
MKPVRKPLLVPSGVVKAAASAGYPFVLLIILDGIPFAEVFAKSRKVFDANLADWKRNTLPSLARSNVRFFFTDGKTINEVAF